MAETGICLRLIPAHGATDIPRKTNYDFERRERERVKAEEAVKKAQAKAEKKAAQQGTLDPEPSDGL